MASSLPPAADSSRSICCSTSARSCLTFSLVSMNVLGILTDHGHTAASAKLFHALDEHTVGSYIISASFHHHHEVVRALEVEEHLGLTFAFRAKRVEGINCGFCGCF